MREVAQRIFRRKTSEDSSHGLSRVEQVMRRNAPDLAGGSEAEVAAAQARRFSHLNARWPRPRLLALLSVCGYMVAVPEVPFVLALCAVVFFLVVSVACGPERARDGARFFWIRFVRLWKHELVVVDKLIRQFRP